MFRVEWALIEQLLAGEPNIVAAWVFGSGKDGQIAAGSDLDLGLLFAAPPALDELLELRGKLQRTLQFDDVDLVVLNEASPITRFEAVSGRLLFARDHEEVAGFVSLTAREFEDSMALIRRGLVWRAEVHDKAASRPAT